MQIIKCFEVMGHTDTTEGRTPKKVVARFSSHYTAETYVKSKAYARWCVMGMQSEQYDIANIREATICICDSIEELEIQEHEEVKARALSKLTKAEREALGFQ